jgi:hypothetical protein
MKEDGMIAGLFSFWLRQYAKPLDPLIHFQ